MLIIHWPSAIPLPLSANLIVLIIYCRTSTKLGNWISYGIWCTLSYCAFLTTTSAPLGPSTCSRESWVSFPTCRFEPEQRQTAFRVGNQSTDGMPNGHTGRETRNIEICQLNGAPLIGALIVQVTRTTQIQHPAMRSEVPCSFLEMPSCSKAPMQIAAVW